MVGLGFYIILLMAAMAAVMFTRIRFEVAFNRRGTDDYLKIEMRAVGGLIRYKTEVPVLELEKFFVEPIIKMEADIESVVTHPIEDKGMLVKIPLAILLKNLPVFIRQGIIHTARYKIVMYRFLKNVRCHHLVWKTEIGLGDPAYTGIISGLLWGVKGFAFSMFRSHIGTMTKPPSFSVLPCFDSTCLKLDFRCIFDLRIGHIITAGLKFVKLRLKAETP